MKYKLKVRNILMKVVHQLYCIVIHINGHISIRFFFKVSVAQNLITSAVINTFPSLFLQLLKD